MSKAKSIIPADYAEFLNELKDRVRSAHAVAVRAVNREMILLYWDIGRAIAERQRAAHWGDSVVDRLASDLKDAFPGLSGFSSRNLRDMKRFWLAYSDPDFRDQVAVHPAFRRLTLRAELVAQPVPERSKAGHTADNPFWPQAVARLPWDAFETFWPQLAASIPWGHHRLILDKLKDHAARFYYVWATAQFGWSRNVLLNQIKAQAYERSTQESKSHNFGLVLPEHLAEQADEMMKSRYNLEFLGISQAVKELDLENRLIDHLQRFILELGYGFCFVGRQYRLALGNKEYFVDLLFYHRFLKALVAFDLKLGSFEPEHAGKMDFYLNLLNDRERGPDDQPSIGIILCAEKDDIEVEYALKTKANPIGVAEYQLQSRLPAEFKGKLPSARQLSEAVRRGLPATQEVR